MTTKDRVVKNTPAKSSAAASSGAAPQSASASNGRLRLATVWLGGCSGCHMSFLDLDEKLMDLAELVDLVYSPIADIKEFPPNVDVALVEGAICNNDHLELALAVRENSRIVVSFGDCAVTGNVPSLRNRLGVDDLLTAVYHEGPGRAPRGSEDHVMPTLLPKVLPLHQIVHVDAFLPGCPPDPQRIWTAVSSLVAGEPVVLEPALRTFG
jgi:NAD-reducing hydrogenase small subunit